ncbi:tandem-95 repeat protein [Rasiella rasia]|uniref:Tandem-95 repeat protein n=1 Tax=Rasiella rasia TaxID=2744027 RepID=A0A6G6GKJ1_9FLAO|nr:Ig-like domain-containing protein [Rasiella rasia]QIE59037.1 tandem-95 repeat protein [Rasiella rasia]
MHNFTFIFWNKYVRKSYVLLALLLMGTAVQAQIGVQSPSITAGVTFQWSDSQTINGVYNDNNPATIKSVTINGTVYNSFAVPSAYQLTRLGPAGNGPNRIAENGNYSSFNSSGATQNINDSNQWDNAAKAAFQSQNLNYYFTSNPNGRSICGNFNAANGLNGVPETDAQMQTLFYDPPLPANAGGVLAVTERGGNNCLYVRLFGFLPGSNTETPLGDTFVRTNNDMYNGNFSPPVAGSDYWGSGREQDNGQTIAIALFQLDNVAPIGSKITRVRFIAASTDHGDGKVFVLQRYAQPQVDMGCVDGTFNGQIDNSSTVPAGSTYTLISGPNPSGVSFTLNSDGSYQYVPSPGFVGDVTFTYKVRLPAPNQNITDTNTVTLTYNPNPPDPTIDVACNPDGSYNVTVTDPVGSNYEYQINNDPYQSSPSFADLGPGTYVFSVRDLSTGCENKPSSTSVTLETLTASVTSVTDVDCFGDDDGTIDITVSGGFPPYSYVWSNGATTEDVSNLAPGTYNVEISDSSGCLFEFLSDIVVDGPTEAISVKETITDVLCFGEATGKISLTVTGGTPGYTYSWSNGATTQNISGLTAGDYTVTILDANNCTYEETFTVMGPTAGILLSTTKVDVLCNGDSTGSIDLTVSGGVPPYSYAWTNGSTLEDISGLTAGNYNVTVTDDNGCTTTLPAPVEITQPEPISIELTKTNASATALCNNGTATATVTGGVGPYTYLWDDPLAQTTPTATGLSGSLLGGTQYTVMVTDANGCVNEQSVIITCVQNCDAVINVTDVTNVLCKDFETGSASVQASSSANPNATFTYTWNTSPQQVDAGVLPGIPSTISGQGAGVYTVSVTIDGTLCQPVEESITITEPSTAVAVTATATDETGPTTNDGTATANPSGGIPPYTFLWSPGGQTTQTITGLSDGTYTVTVKDANNCMATTQVTVNNGDCNNLTATASSTPVSCNGGNDGTATVNVSGGLGNFTYAWSPGGQTTQSISGLTAGVYTVTVTDEDTLCTATSSTTVGEPTELTSGIAVTNVACFGESTGSLDLTVSGGTPGYTFLWSNGETTEDISNLSAGTYTVVITDGNGCVLNDSGTVGQPTAALDVAITAQTDIVCESGLGSVTVEASGGTAPYSYTLDGGAPQGSGTFNNLAAGTYTVTAIDSNLCSDTVQVTILANCTIAVNDFRDTVVNISIDGNVLTNDEDMEGDNQVVTTLTVTSDQGVVVNIAPDGSYTYTPPTDYVGGDFFMYSIEDDGNPQATDSATVFIRINPIGQNNTIANADAVFTEQDVAIPGNVLTNDVDLEGDNQTVTNPGTYNLPGGVLVLNSNGTFVYTPNPGFTGTDTFTYEIIDDNALPATDTAVLTITVVGNPAMNYTFAVDDGYGGNQGATITGNVLDNDFDPEGNDQTVDVAISPSNGPTNGSVTLNADGSFSYTPTDPNFFGNDSFIYSIFDNGSPVATDSATVSIIIAGENTTIAVNDFRDTVVNIPIDGNVLTNDEDMEGDNQVVTTLTVTSDQGVVVNIAPDGSYTYTPPTDYVGGDFFMYSIEDDGNPQATDSATVFIRINPIGQNNTIANADAVFTEQDVAIPGNVLTNDVDLEGDNQTVTNPGTYNLPGGVLVLNSNGTFVYTPNPGFTGTDTFTYEIIDDNALPATDTAVLTITVVGNPAMNYTFAVDDGYGGNQGATITGNVLDNDFDPEGNDQTVDVAISPSNGPTNGSVTLNADGSFSYTPTDPNFFGNDSFIYSIFDNGSPVATDSATVSIIIAGENLILAVDDINNTYVGFPVSGNVATNDENYDGPIGTETFTLVSGPTAGGTLTFNPDGTYNYTPPVDPLVSEDTFVYQICDAGNPVACDTATVYIEILPTPNTGNEPPVANADTNTTEVDTPVTGQALPNDFDPDGDTITVTANTDPANGTVTIDANGMYTYTPDPGFIGEDTFEYTICDDATPALCDTTTVTIQVIADEGNITVANDDAYNGIIDTDIVGNVLDNDTDPEGDNQDVNTTVTPVSGPSNGTLTINADGSFTYVPNIGFVGTDQFVYEILDDNANPATDQATVYLTVGNGVNEILAIDDINDTFVNLPVEGSVATNDLNADGPAGTEVFTLVTGPANGMLVFNPDGSYTYTPGTDYVGEDTFEYQVCDGGNPVACDTAIVYIEVQPLGSPDNDPPVANADTNSTQVDTPVDGTVLPNDFDPDGDPIVVTGNTDPANGSVTVNPDGTYTYTPDPGFIGEDTFEYTICDNQTPALCDTATVTIQVLDTTENITTAVDDAYYGFPDTDIVGNVLDNDTDPENNDQTVDVAVSPSNGPNNGTVVLNADGTFTYTPGAGFEGTDSFVYEIFDNGSPVATDVATVYISIANPANEILAIDDINDTFVNLPVEGSVATNDLNEDGPTGTEVFTLVTGPANGMLVFNPDGSYTYTPGTDYVGEDTFEYQVCDGGNPIACDTAIVYIEVQPLGSPDNDPPVANADTNSTQVDTPVDGTVLPNDFDPDGDPIVVTGNTDPANGSVTVNPDGTYTYTPDPGFIGEDTFEYTICDNQTPALCDTATVTIQVLDTTENITTAVDDAYYGFPDTDIVGNVLDNDTDPENNDQTVDVAVSPSNGPNNGTVVLNADGTFTYTPGAGFEGTDSFVYEIFDNGSPVATDVATVYISIANPANEILAIDDINDTFVNLPVEGSVATNDLNEDGPTGTEVFTLVTGPANGMLVFNPDGSYTYTPGTDYVGEDTFEYQVCDGGNPIACDTAIVYIEVQPLGSPDNDPPVANADTNSTQVDTPVDGTVLPNDFDPDGDPIVVTGNTDPANGSVTVNPDGTYTYTPDPGFIGEDTFEYTICDNQTPALCDTATVTIQVLDTTENITTAVDDAYYGFPDTDIVGNVLDNDTDPENNDQTVDVAVSPSNGPNNGTVVLNADGTFTYTPGAGFEGTDSFVYEIFDNGSPVATDVATVYISIANPANEILAIDDINDTFVNLPVEGSVATNDLNADGPTGTEVFTLVTGPANGMLVFNPDGSYTYTPGTDYVGEDTFEYQVCDGGNPIACDTAIVYIEVQPLGSPDNDPPVANADTNSTQVDTPVDGTVLPNDFDPDGDPIVVTGNTDPANGSVTVNPDGTYTYTPDPGFIGEDTFEYTICDNQTPALCDTATVTIQVLDTTENITTAVDDAYYGFPDTDIVGNVLDNDTDPENNDQTVDVAVSPSNGPNNGTVVLNADGTFTYTPGAGFEGTDSFVYEIFDNGSPVATDVATVYISIADPGNEILAVDDINDTFVDLPVSGNVATNDENFDGPTGTEVFTLVSGPTAGGTLTFNPDGTYDYTPAPGFVGEDTFVYQVCDAGNPVACDTATVTISIVDDPVIGNDPPVANNDVNITEINTPVDGNVLVNDFDPDLGDIITVTANTDPANGSVTVSPDGSYTYIPNPGFTGEDTFEYTICDNAATPLCDTATVTIYIIDDTGNITVANDDAYYGEIDAPVTGNVLDNDSDPESNTQVLNVGTTPVSGPTNGTVIVNPDGSFEYTPGTGFTGNDQFVYEIFDNGSPVATDQATVYILIAQTPAPAIAIVKAGVFVDGDGDQCADPGESIDYTFTVTNEGNVSLSAISVTDPLLEAPNPVVAIVFAGGDTDGDSELDVDETWTYTASYAITQADIDAGEITNQATAEGTDEDGTTVDDLSDESLTTEDDPTVTTLCQSPAIAIVKAGVFVDGDGDQCADPGESIDYTFTVTNEGNVSLSAISVTDPLLEAPNPVVAIVFAGGDTDGDSELDVDETWTYTASYAITQADIDAGEITNQATAEGTAPDSTVVDDLSDESLTTEDDPTVTTLCQSPAIAIVKAGVFVDGDGDQCADPGESIDYTFTVTNEGNVSLSAISVTDPLLEAPNPVVAIVFAGGDTDGDSELDVDETWTYTASYAITQADIDAGEITNQATAEGTAPDSTVVDDLSDESLTTEDDPTVTTLCQSPAIAIVKAGVFVDGDGDQCADPGESIDYTFTVTNEGNVSLSAISVTDPLLEAPNPVVAIVFAGGDTDGDSELDVDETWTYTASYAITQADIDAGEITNQATAEGTAPDSTVVDDLSDESLTTEDDPTVTTLCQSPAIAIVKAGVFVDGDGDQCADPGESIDYTFTVTNEGNVSLSAISVTDPLLEAPNPVVAIVFAGGDTDGDSELDVDETWTYTASYAITQADIDAGEITNQATAEGTAPDSTVVDDLSDESLTTEDDPTVTTLCQSPAIAIVKAGVFVDGDGDQCADPGESIDYTFTVTNEGNVSLSAISVTDPLLEAPNPVVAIVFAGGDTDGDSELDVDETWTYTASYAITQADIDAGEITNQATAVGTAPDSTVVDDLSDESLTTEDDPTVTTLCQSPAIAIVKAGVFVDGDGDQCADPGESIDYTFTVTNEGNVSLSAISVTDPLLEAPNPVVAIVFAGGDTDGDSELDVDETWTYTASYAITQADIDAGEITNQATAEGTAPDSTVVDDLSDESLTTEDDPTVTALCQSPSIALIKKGTLNDENGSGCTDVGETISYVFEVKNTGNVTLTGVDIDDPLVNVVGGPIVLAPDEIDVLSFTAVYTITQVDIDNGSFENTATAMGTAPDGTVVEDISDFDVYTDDRPTVTTLCQNASIALIKEGTVMDENGSGCADPKETIEYRFTVQNTGNVTLTNIDIEDPLVNVLGGPITLAPGQTDVNSFMATYLITQANINDGFVENQATVIGTDPNGEVVDDESDFDSFLDDRPTITTLCQGASIALIKTANPQDQNGNGCVELGESIIYEFVVKNTGNVVLTNITVTDPLVAVTGGPITLNPSDSDSDTFRAEYFVTQEDVDNGFVMNQATAEGTAPDGSVVMDLSDDDSFDEDEVTELSLCQDPRVSLEKSGIFNDDNGDGIPQVGETISYIFRVENTGNVSLYNLTLEDDLEGIVIEGGPIDVLAVGEVDDSTFTATYAITEGDIENGEVINQALITGTTSDGTTVEDTSDDPNDLTNIDINGDGDPDDPTVTLLPNVGTEVTFEIFNGITPDGDGLNDFFRVQGIEFFPDNNMKIFNRWGVLVYETDGYGGATGEENVFRGYSEGRVTVNDSKTLPTGTYFYVLVRQDPNSGEMLKNSGYLYINR